MPISRQRAITRAAPFAGQGTYGLGRGSRFKPGEEPPPSPFEYVDTERIGKRYQSDCIRFVLWAYKCAHHDPAFPEYEGDINVDSALMDAGCLAGGKGLRKYFSELLPYEAQAGDLLMFPSVRASELHDTSVPGNTRVRIGHTGMISGCRSVVTMDTAIIEQLSVLECSGGGVAAIKHHWDTNFHTANNRKDVTWRGELHTNDNWRTRIIRYVGP